jgi:hypothetical protein
MARKEGEGGKKEGKKGRTERWRREEGRKGAR